MQTMLSLKTEKSIKQDFFSLITVDDVAYEEECVRNPYSLRCWLRYLNHKSSTSLNAQYFIYERAVKGLPGSYKLWKMYLDLRVSQLLDCPPQRKAQKYDPIPVCEIKVSPFESQWSIVNQCFERALVLCNKYPVIWLMYTRFLMYQPNPSKVRRTFDRALKALPLTQHPRIWKLYLKWSEKVGGETCSRIWKRYLKLDYRPEDYVEICLKLDEPLYLEAAKTLSSILETPSYVSPNGKSLHDLWVKLTDLVCDYAEDIEIQASESSLLLQGHQGNSNNASNFDVERVLRFGISKFPEQSGVLWTSLAKWWCLKGEFERARDIYEEAMTSVISIKDFTLIFDAYGEFEESILSLYISKTKSDNDAIKNAQTIEEDLEIDLRLVKLEKLMERRPFLINDVLLRQNPNSTEDWEKRASLYMEKKQFEKVVESYQKAISTIHSKKASGNFAKLITNFAKFYEGQDRIEDARLVFEKSKSIHFKKVDELADLWCEYAELELRHNNFEKALSIMGRATAPPSHVTNPANVSYTDESISPQSRLFKSMKLWSLYVDLEESIGTVESTKSVYDRILELKIANPKIIINYANFLEERNFFEESYKVYERGIDLFGYPVAFDIWNLYLSKFINRYNGTKIERARDLFEQALEKCPPKYAKSLYLMFAKLEEEHGIAKHAMRIYQRAAENIDIKDLYELYMIYISKASSFFGLTSTREIYERALQQLPDEPAKAVALKFSEMEVSLGEIDRARAILAYASPFADPKKDDLYWKSWHDFEVKHGNEDTFKEMLRIKRTVQAKLTSDIAYISTQIVHSKASAPVNPMEALEKEMEEEIDAEALTRQNTKVSGFVRALVSEKKHVPSVDDVKVVETNPNEIEIDESDGEKSKDREKSPKRQKVE